MRSTAEVLHRHLLRRMPTMSFGILTEASVTLVHRNAIQHSLIPSLAEVIIT